MSSRSARHTEDKYAAEVAMKALDGTTIAGSQVSVTDGKCSNKAVVEWQKNLAKTAIV